MSRRPLVTALERDPHLDSVAGADDLADLLHGRCVPPAVVLIDASWTPGATLQVALATIMELRAAVGPAGRQTTAPAGPDGPLPSRQ